MLQKLKYKRLIILLLVLSIPLSWSFADTEKDEEQSASSIECSCCCDKGNDNGDCCCSHEQGSTNEESGRESKDCGCSLANVHLISALPTKEFKLLNEDHIYYLILASINFTPQSDLSSVYRPPKSSF